MALNDEKDEIKETVFNFESQKIISLNKFFMKSVVYVNTKLGHYIGAKSGQF